jgi:hypothetical protein
MPEMVPVYVTLGSDKGARTLGTDTLARQSVGYLVHSDDAPV